MHALLCSLLSKFVPAACCCCSPCQPTPVIVHSRFPVDHSIVGLQYPSRLVAGQEQVSLIPHAVAATSTNMSSLDADASSSISTITTPSEGPIIYHIPFCPFAQRLEILLKLKGMSESVAAASFHAIDITVPRPRWLLDLMGDSTSPLPILQTSDGKVIKESLVILQYLDELYPDVPIARTDPYERAVERMLISQEANFTRTGYVMVMHQDGDRHDELKNRLLDLYANLNQFLLQHNPEGTYLFDTFGLAEAVYSPTFLRFWFMEYYEDFDLPTDDVRFDRVRKWRDACLKHPAAQQLTKQGVIDSYYDYAKGIGNEHWLAMVALALGRHLC